jgi:hypothetical protein
MAGGPGGKPPRSRAARRKSRCQVPQAPDEPYTWHFHSETAQGDDVWREMVLAIDAAVAAHDRPGLDRASVVNGLIGDVRGLLRQAAKGRLREGSDLKPIRLDPVLWELRWDFKKFGRMRQYHAEPAANPTLLVALHFHKKVECDDAKATEAAQDDAIKTASRRYADGVKYAGVHPVGCPDCREP